jgi:hypothetical protein
LRIDDAVKTRTPIKPDAARLARLANCTIERAKQMLARNAEGFREMAEKAELTGNKVNGYTAVELRASEADYREASA